ncbi:MAG: ATP-binding protein [Bacteroidota bacterium]
MPSPFLETVYPSDLSVVPAAVEDVEAFGEAHGLVGEVQDRVLLSVAEVVANAIEHGNVATAGASVRLRLEASSEGWTLRVTDEGTGLAHDTLDSASLPSDILDTGGRGLFIIQQLADEVWLEEEGRCVCLRFKAAADDAAS